MGAQQLGVDEVNFFKDDNTVLHFSKPEAYASIQNNTFIVSGEPETKNIKDLLPDILQQLGPKQHKALKDIVTGGLQAASEEVPNLVETPADLNKPEWLLHSGKKLFKSKHSWINLGLIDWPIITQQLDGSSLR